MRKTEGWAKSKEGWTQLTQSFPKILPINATGELDAEVMMVTEWRYSLYAAVSVSLAWDWERQCLTFCLSSSPRHILAG